MTKSWIPALVNICIASFAVTVVLWGVGAISDHGGEIVFHYFAFLVFLFVSLPLHLVAIPLIVYVGLKSAVHAAFAWRYAYFAGWLILHGIVFSSFIVVELPELVGKAVFKITHEAEIELTRALQQHDADPVKVKTLIDAGVDVNQVDQYIGFPPIVWAARQGDAEIVDMLIDAGADVEVVIHKRANAGIFNEIFLPEVTALGFAAVSKNDAQRLAVVQTLLDHGSDPNRGLPLLGVCAMGDVASLQVLTAAGANLESQDLNQNSCSHLAAHNGKVEMLAYLLRNGHIDTGSNEHNRSPLDLALNNRQGEAIVWLLQQGFRPRSDDSLARYLAEEPTDVAAKKKIRKMGSVLRRASHFD